MESLTYNYNSGTNQLNYIADSANLTVGGTYDLHNQPSNNYGYDPIANIIKDSINKISNINWNVYGKITGINRSAPLTTDSSMYITYTYYAAGNRISKRITKQGTTTVSYTWYVRDASGNVLATYTASGDGTQTLDHLVLYSDKFYLYGSSRLGLLASTQSVDSLDSTTVGYTAPCTGNNISWSKGAKQYELDNHLGNVLVTVSDDKLGVHQTSDSSLIDHYMPVVVNAQDYYPFGMLEQGRIVASGSGYRYGFNGKEKDDEAQGVGNQIDYGERVYDPRVGKFLSVDPISKKYPELTPYQFASNTPIMGVDLDGKELFIIHGTNQGNTPLIENNKGVIFGDDKQSNSTIKNQFLRITGNSVSDDKFRWHAPLWNNQDDRTLAAIQLVGYIITTRKFMLDNKLITEKEPISLLGYSNGGNVAIQTSNILNKLFDVKVNLITLSTPAHRSGFIFKNPEDPRESTGINYHINITHENDAVWFFARGLPSFPAPSDNYYVQEKEIPLKGGIESHTELPKAPELGKYLEKIPTMIDAPKPLLLDKYIKQAQTKEHENTQTTNTQSTP
jgi:RHS repeat-associated protein